MIYLIISLLFFGFWIYTEQKRIHFLARVGSGLACMVFLCLTTSFVAKIIPSYEHSFHKTDMLQMEMVLTNGDTQTVLRALHTYNGISATGTTYQAALEMRQFLYESEKH